MHNVAYEVNGNTLTIKVDISAKAIDTAPRSSTGKTLLVGTSGGQISLAGNGAAGVAFAINVTAKR